MTSPGLRLTQPAAHSAPGCLLGTTGWAADLPHPHVLIGHGDYAYQQSYSEQGYDRPFEESTQHYYEGGECAPCHTPWPPAPSLAVPGMGGELWGARQEGQAGSPRAGCVLLRQEVWSHWDHRVTSCSTKRVSV